MGNPRPPVFRSILLLLLACLTVTNAQQIIASNLPACAANCQMLQNAQSLCIPPDAPPSTAQTYKTCFCNSNYLVPFKTSPQGVCDSVCDSSDLSTIQKWFNSFCSDPNSLPATTGGTATAGGSNPTAATTTGGATSTSSSAPSRESSQNQTWISTHWRWVIFLVIFLLAIAIGSVGGLWLKRRYRRRHDARMRAFNAGGAKGPAMTMPMSNPAAMRSVDFAPMAQRSRGPSRADHNPSPGPSGRPDTKGKGPVIGSRELDNVEEIDEPKKSLHSLRSKGSQRSQR